MRVLVIEEYGFRLWWWLPPLGWGWEDIVQWWKSLPTVEEMVFNARRTLEGFPGTLIPIEDLDDEPRDVVHWGSWAIHIHEDEDSSLRSPRIEPLLDSTFYTHAGYKPHCPPPADAPLLGHFILEPEDPLVVGNPPPRIVGFQPTTDEPKLVLP